MAYGKIDLTARDIAFLQGRLERCAERIEASVTSASSSDERMFYERATVKVDEWMAAVSRYVPGVRRFDEGGLQYLRGAISETAGQSSLAHRLVQAKQSGDSTLGDLEAEYQQWVKLSAKLEQPFLADKSQDAAPEEEDEGD
jgi:hypothetical protein